MYNVNACFQVIPNIDHLLILAKNKKNSETLVFNFIIFYGKIMWSSLYIHFFIFQIMSATLILGQTVVYIFKHIV